ncbi:nei1 [Symbiodinium sp. CCMP2592]|nr:nei1 [Symbiodinium sp. CCMP2592]
MALLSLGSLQVEVREWFASLIPRRFAHRQIALGAAGKVVELLEEILATARKVTPTCPDRRTSTKKIMTAFNAFVVWATAQKQRNGTVEFGGYHNTGPGGVAFLWAHQVGEELIYALDWEAELHCKGRSQLDMIGGAFVGIARLQSIWPWLVDCCATATYAKVPAVIPRAVLFKPNPPEVLLHLLQGLAVKAPLMVEVGVDVGQTSEFLLEAMPNLTLFGVDPYPGFYDNQRSGERRDKMGGEEAFSEALARYKRFPLRARLRREASASAAAMWKEEKLPDLVFVDGEHDFESCARDIRSWSQLVPPGGVVAGHDYRAGVEGVPRAVHALIPESATLHLGPHGVWWWRVPPR